MLDHLPPRFINWRSAERHGKITKQPVDAIGNLIDVTDPENWRTYSDALATGSVGFVISAQDDLVFLDFDNAARDGEWKPETVALVQPFISAGAAYEVSQSGIGLHIIGRVCDKFRFVDRKNRWEGPNGIGCEFYSERRFVAFGPQGWNGSFYADITSLVDQHVPRHASVSELPHAVGGPLPGALGPTLTDDQLLEKATNSRGSAATAFGDKASFGDLWSANPVALAKHYPDPTRPFDHSRADAALMARLCFWTGADAERMERLMSRSVLGDRNKWRDRADYRSRTIQNAINQCQAIYDGGVRRREQLTENSRIGEAIDNAQLLPVIMTPDQMTENLVLIGGHSVVDRTTKRVRSKADAATEFAASTCDLVDERGKLKTVSVLSIWLRSPSRRSVDALTWRPNAQEFMNTPEKHGLAYNKFRGFHRFPVPSDWQERVQPFIDHIRYLIPNDAEFRRFMQWLAHMAQRPEELPVTAWLFVASKTGIGRNLLSGMLVRCFSGYVASGIQLAPLLDGNFNDRLSEKILAVVDEVREGMGEKKYQRAERLKSLITEEFRLINGKHERQFVEYNCCRFLMFTNHADGLPFEENDRRINVVENPTERRSPEYYDRLYALLDDPLFIASVQEYLFTMSLVGFRPGEHAFENDAKAKNLDAMRSPAEKVILEFKNSWTGDIAGRSDLKNYMMDCGVIMPSDTALNHMITRSGIRSPGKRINRWNGMKDSVIILRNFTDEQIKNADNATITSHIQDSAIKFKP